MRRSLPAAGGLPRSLGGSPELVPHATRKRSGKARRTLRLYHKRRRGVGEHRRLVFLVCLGNLVLSGGDLAAAARENGLETRLDLVLLRVHGLDADVHLGRD